MSQLFTNWNMFLTATIMVMVGVYLDGGFSPALLVGGFLLMFGIVFRAIYQDCMDGCDY